MALQGLRAEQQQPQVNFNDEVGASVDALDRLGLAEDREQLAESIAADFAGLGESGRTGEAYVQLPRGLVTLPTMVAVLDGTTYPRDKKYPATYVYNNLWTPGTDPDGLKAEDIGNLEDGQQDAVWPAHARLAVHSSVSGNEPLLHFLGQPFDEKYADDGEETQLQAIAKAKAAFEVAYLDFAMTPLNVNAVAMIGLTRRIKGETMPIEWGFMRDATLPRKTVDGRSMVGLVRSGGGRLRLDWSRGSAGSSDGVGLSVGPKELDPQAS